MTSLAGFHVLVVEDDADLNEIICDFFSLADATVSSARNGKEALEVLSQKNIDFVMSDIQMPVMDGFGLLKSIRSKNSRIPIVLMASGQTLLTETEAKNLGAAGLINKPFNKDFLIDTVYDLLKEEFPQRTV